MKNVEEQEVTRYEYVVHSYQEPSRTRYQSTFSNICHGITEVFQGEDEAFEEAFKLIRNGAFDVTIRLDMVTEEEDTVCNIEPLPCPYETLGINQELQELNHHKQEVQDALSWAVMDAPSKVDEYAETLEKINREIMLIK